jgi:hypothetical protein
MPEIDLFFTSVFIIKALEEWECGRPTTGSALWINVLENSSVFDYSLTNKKATMTFTS